MDISLFLFHDYFMIGGFLWSLYHIQFFFDVVRNELQTRVNQKKIKSSKKYMSCERALNFYQ